MAAKAFDLVNYGRLLGEAVPVVIESEEQNDRTLIEIRALQEKQELSPEEEELLKLLILLVEDFEKRHYSLKRATPAEALRELLRSRAMKASDLWEIFGSKGITSEVLRGKRAISKERAKMLAQFFNVPVDLFI
jgi:HTH-type transcriptional regulator/antitoxin HigA